MTIPAASNPSSHNKASSRWKEGLQVVGLVAVITLLWCHHYQMWNSGAWRVPLDYSGDSHEMLTRIKAASEGDTWPLMPQVIHRLAAPWGAHWNGYPTPDKFLILALGGLTHLVGLGAAANLAMLLATISSGVAFYFVARCFKARPEWAWMGGLLFAFTYSVFHRGLAHLLLLFTWTVPLGLLVCWYLARRRPLRWRSAEAWVCLGVAAAIGVSNPYYLFFWSQLLAWAMIVQFFRGRQWVNLQVGAACFLVAAGGFFLMHAEFWLYSQSGALPVLARNYFGTEIYALKIVEMFVPPTYHRWEWLAFFGHRYSRWTEWRGEAFFPYLGLVGMAGFVWLWIDAGRRMLRGRAPSGWSLQTLWMLLFATVGGITNLMALYLGLNVFRATNRIAVFIGCVVLLFVARKMSVLTRNIQPFWRYAAAALLALFGAFDQIPRRPPAERQLQREKAMQADAAFGRRLEAALRPGAMVFQLPVMGFPEVVPPHKLADYELFRPYLHTSTLRFSYGGAKKRSRIRWQRDVEKLPVGEMVNRLERFGFSALYFNRRGFADSGTGLIASLKGLGYTGVIDGGRDQVAVVLKGDASPDLPLGSTLTFGEGWYSLPDNSTDVHWSYGPSVLLYFNPFDDPLPVKLEFTLSGTVSRTAVLSFQEEIVMQAAIGEAPVKLPPVSLVLQPGVNRIDLSSPEPIVRLNQGRNQLRCIGLHQVRVTAPGPENVESRPARSHRRDSRSWSPPRTAPPEATPGHGPDRQP